MGEANRSGHSERRCRLVHALSLTVSLGHFPSAGRPYRSFVSSVRVVRVVRIVRVVRDAKTPSFIRIVRVVREAKTPLFVTFVIRRSHRVQLRLVLVFAQDRIVAASHLDLSLHRHACHRIQAGLVIVVAPFVLSGQCQLASPRPYVPTSQAANLVRRLRIAIAFAPPAPSYHQRYCHASALARIIIASAFTSPLGQARAAMPSQLRRRWTGFAIGHAPLNIAATSTLDRVLGSTAVDPTKFYSLQPSCGRQSGERPCHIFKTTAPLLGHYCRATSQASAAAHCQQWGRREGGRRTPSPSSRIKLPFPGQHPSFTSPRPR